MSLLSLLFVFYGVTMPFEHIFFLSLLPNERVLLLVWWLLLLNMTTIEFFIVLGKGARRRQGISYQYKKGTGSRVKLTETYKARPALRKNRYSCQIEDFGTAQRPAGRTDTAVRRGRVQVGPFERSVPESTELTATTKKMCAKSRRRLRWGWQFIIFAARTL